MSIITIYNTTTGRITRWVDVLERFFELQPGANEAYIIGEVSEDNYIDVGSKEPIKKPLKPSEYHVFDYTIKQWIDPRTAETEWVIVRNKRNKLLQESDWTQLPDVPLATKESWALYRQALRDVTNQTDPFNIIWPNQPE